MLLVPPNSHPHSSHSPSLVEPPQSPSNRSSPGQPSPPSPPQVKPNIIDSVTNPPHMSGLSEAHYPPPPVSTAASRSPQAAPPATYSAPGTPAPTTPTPAPPTTNNQTRPSSGGSASGGSSLPVTTTSSSSVGGLGSAAGGVVTTGTVGTGGASTGGLPPAMPVPGPSVTPSGGSSGPGQPLHHPLLGYVPHGSNKILSRNINGTRESGGSVGDKKNTMVSVTAHPSNESELQLYRVLQRANLLNYYDTFISQGGDDVQQLCEAGEEEFLEIMALVGMASKPLHVRRLQKALQEWVSNPVWSMAKAEKAMFQIPLLPNLPSSVVAAGYGNIQQARALLAGGAAPGSTPGAPGTRPSPPMSTANSQPGLQSHLNHNSSPGITKVENMTMSNSNSLGSGRDLGGMASIPSTTASGGLPSGGRGDPLTAHGLSALGLGGMAGAMVGGLPGGLPGPMGAGMPGGMGGMPGGLGGSLGGSRGTSPHHTSPTHPGNLPPTSVGMQVSVNEAAAQICKFMPALLTRRDELFPLARQVVRDSGYQYSKGHSRSQTVIGRDDEPRNKRSRSESGFDSIDLKNDLQWKKRQERLEAISEELRHMSEKAEEVRTSITGGNGNLVELTQQMDALQSRHAQLTIEQNELIKAQRKAKSDRMSVCSEDRERGEDSDSQFSYSGASSPNQVLSSSQGNIIAVANPALSLSAAMASSQMTDEERHISALYTLSQTVGAAQAQAQAQAKTNTIKQEPGSPGPVTKQE